MNTKELIRALREDAEWAKANELETPITLGDNLEAAADRLEALLAENEHFREVTKMILKWRPVSEPPKEDGRYLCSVMSLVSNGRNYADILKWDKDGFRDGHIYTDLVTHWMPLPSTEGVE